MLVRRRLELHHVPAGRYLPAEVVVAEVQNRHPGVPERHRHAAVDPVVAQVQERQLHRHLHAGEVEPEIVPGQVDGAGHHLAPPEEERRVAGELVVGHPELQHVPLERESPGDSSGEPVAVQHQDQRPVGLAAVHQQRRDGPDQVVVGGVEGGEVRELPQRPGDRAVELAAVEADGGEVGAVEARRDGARHGGDHEVEDGEVREVAEGVRDGAVQARHLEDAERLQLVEQADGRRQRGRDVDWSLEEELGDTALLVAGRGPPRPAERAGPPSCERVRVAELLPDLDESREVLTGQLRLRQRRGDQLERQEEEEEQSCSAAGHGAARSSIWH